MAGKSRRTSSLESTVGAVSVDWPARDRAMPNVSRAQPAQEQACHEGLVLRAFGRAAVHGQMREKGLDVSLTISWDESTGQYDLGGTAGIPRPPPVGLDGAGCQTADLGRLVLIEVLHTLQRAAQALLGPFARSDSTHPHGSAGIDMRKPRGILNAFCSQNRKLDVVRSFREPT